MSLNRAKTSLKTAVPASLKNKFKVLALVLFCVFTSAASALTVDKLIVFGDSLSDNGNFYAFSYGFVPKSPPYFQGRFSNGLTWVEHVAAGLHLSVKDKHQFVNYAYGGATAHADRNDVSWQVNKYIKQAAEGDQNKQQHLYVMWIGSNDYLTAKGDVDEETTKTVAAIQENLEKLIGNGARHFVVLNLPDLGKTPIARMLRPAYAKKVSQLVQLHNAKLRRMLAKEKIKHRGVQFVFFNVSRYFSAALANPQKFGLTNSKDACYADDIFMYTALDDPQYKLGDRPLRNHFAIVHCGDADHHLFWDHVHPTRVVHEKIAENVLQRLRVVGMKASAN